MRKFLFLALTAGLTCIGAVSFSSTPSNISSDKTVYLATDYVHLTAQGLTPKTTYTVETHVTDNNGINWSGKAEFVTGKDGKIDFNSTPVKGTYAVPDSQGLFWSMLPEKSIKDRDFFNAGDSFSTKVTLLLNSSVVDELNFTTLSFKQGLTIVESRKPDAVYDLVHPIDSDKKNIGIVYLGGSEGGLSPRGAKQLASKGYTVFNLAYFGEQGLPKELINIPLEYAISNIKKFKADNPDLTKIILWGGSKGAEFALLLGSMLPNEIQGVIAQVPSHVIWQGISMTDFSPKSSWQMNNKPLDFAPIIFGPNDFSGEIIMLRKGYENTIKQIPNLSFAEIAVENITGPILLISGTDDQVWPSSTMAEKIEARLKKNNFAYKLVNLIYTDAGHWVDIRPTIPKRARIFGDKFSAGGTTEADGIATTDATKKVFEFLEGLK